LAEEKHAISFLNRMGMKKTPRNNSQRELNRTWRKKFGVLNPPRSGQPPVRSQEKGIVKVFIGHLAFPLFRPAHSGLRLDCYSSTDCGRSQFAPPRARG
jgi:hypothetical protein